MKVERSYDVGAPQSRWGTPPGVSAPWGPYALDACAEAWSSQAPVWYGFDPGGLGDGLAGPWWGSTWCNPPYGRELPPWAAKAILEAQRGVQVTFLALARTDTRWFHDLVFGAEPVAREVHFIQGRLYFLDPAPPHARAATGCPVPSVVIRLQASDRPSVTIHRRCYRA